MLYLVQDTSRGLKMCMFSYDKERLSMDIRFKDNNEMEKFLKDFLLVQGYDSSNEDGTVEGKKRYRRKKKTKACFTCKKPCHGYQCNECYRKKGTTLSARYVSNRKYLRKLEKEGGIRDGWRD